MVDINYPSTLFHLYSTFLGLCNFLHIKSVCIVTVDKKGDKFRHLSKISAVLLVFCASRPWQESFPLWWLDGLHNRWPWGCVEVCTQPHHCEEIHLLPGHRGHQRPPWITRSSDGKKRYSGHTSLITWRSRRKTPETRKLMAVYATLRDKRPRMLCPVSRFQDIAHFPDRGPSSWN